MTEVKIKNFQSIADADFKIEGFTVIVGKNNIGKSAVIRAIDAALTNQSGKDFIQVGKTKTSVEIKNKDIDIIWNKKETTSSYTVNGQTYTKLNRAVPQPIIDAGFDKMEIGDKKVCPLIAPQFKPLFLVNETGPVVTEILASFYNIDTLSDADDSCQKDLKSQKSLLKLRESDLSDVVLKLEKYKDFEALKSAVEALVSKEKRQVELNAEIKTILEYETRIKQLSDSIKALKSIETINLPDNKILKAGLEDVLWIKEKEQTIRDSATKLKSLQSIGGVNIPKNEGIEKSLSDIIWLKDREQKIQDLIQTVNALKNIDKVSLPETDLEGLIQTCNQIKSWETSIEVLNRKIEKQGQILSIDISGLREKQEQIEIWISDFSRMVGLESEFSAQVVRTKATRDELKTVTDELNGLEKEKADIKICVTCGRPL